MGRERERIVNYTLQPHVLTYFIHIIPSEEIIRGSLQKIKIPTLNNIHVAL